MNTQTSERSDWSLRTLQSVCTEFLHNNRNGSRVFVLCPREGNVSGGGWEGDTVCRGGVGAL